MAERQDLFYARAEQQINDKIKNSEQVLASSATRKLGMFDQFGTKMASSMNNQIKRTVSATMVLLNNFANSTERSLIQVTQRSTIAFSRMFDKIKQQANGMNPSKWFSFSLGGSGGGGFGGKGGSPLAGLDIGKMTASLGMFTGLLTKLVPSLVAVASVGGFIATVLSRIGNYAQELKPMLLTLGGSDKRLSQFRDKITDISTAASISTDKVIDLGNAFQQVGLRVDNMDASMQDMLVNAGKGMRLFDLSADILAKYARNMSAAGRSGADFYGEMDTLYQQMQFMNLTVQDLNMSIQEGTDQWSNYGGTLGKTIGEFSEGIMHTKGLFRALNIDAKEVGKSIESAFGGTETRRRQASLIASMTGMRGSAAFNMLTEDPGRAQGLMIEAAMKQMVRQLGPNAAALGMTTQQRQGAFTDDQRMGISSTTDMMSRTLAQRGVNPKVLGQAMSDYSAYIQKSGGSVSQASIGAWMQSRVADQSSGTMKTMAEATEGLNNTLPEVGARIERFVMKLVDDFSNFVTKSFPDMLDKVNGILGVAESGYSAARNILGAKVPPLASSVGTMASNAVGATGAAIQSVTQSASNMVLNGAATVGGAAKSATQAAANISTNGLNLDALNKYRKAQGMAPTRKWHANMLSNAAVVAQEALKAGADPATAIATMLQESGGNQSVAGDYGYFAPHVNKKGRVNPHYFYSDPKRRDARTHATSIGLFQLHSAGKGAGMTMEQMTDPRQNAARAVKEMGTLKSHHPDWNPGKVAAMSQRPADQAGYERSVNALYPLAQQILALMREQHGELSKQTTALSSIDQTGKSNAKGKAASDRRNSVKAGIASAQSEHNMLKHGST